LQLSSRIFPDACGWPDCLARARSILLVGLPLLFGRAAPGRWLHPLQAISAARCGSEGLADHPSSSRCLPVQRPQVAPVGVAWAFAPARVLCKRRFLR
jgi:hypothetical protein